MLSPMMTVFVLVVLWLIVVVPMVVRRNDERKRDRPSTGSARPCARSAGARTRRHPGLRPHRACGEPAAPSGRAAAVDPPPRARRPGGADVPRRPLGDDRGPRADDGARRRSLTILIAGTVVFLPLALFLGGICGCPGSASPSVSAATSGSCAARPQGSRAAPAPPAARAPHAPYRVTADATARPTQTSPPRPRIGRAHRRRRHRVPEHGHDRPDRPVQRGQRGRPAAGAGFLAPPLLP